MEIDITKTFTEHPQNVYSPDECPFCQAAKERARLGGWDWVWDRIECPKHAALRSFRSMSVKWVPETVEASHVYLEMEGKEEECYMILISFEDISISLLLKSGGDSRLVILRDGRFFTYIPEEGDITKVFFFLFNKVHEEIEGVRGWGSLWRCIGEMGVNVISWTRRFVE